MLTWSENPQRDMLQHLEMLAHTSNCEKLISGKIISGRNNNNNDSSSIIRKKATEISFAVKQGIEFFKNADDADISISPLLVYYGMLSFSKALIIANSQENIFLNDIKYHGLTTRPKNNNQILQKQRKNNWKLIKEYANVNDGVFLELGKVLGVNLQKDYVFYFKDTIVCVPEIKEIIEKYKILNSRVIRAYTKMETEDDKIIFGIYSEDIDKFEKICPELKKNFSKEIMHGNKAFTKYKSINAENLENFNYFSEYLSVIGGMYFIAPTIYEFNGKKKKMLLPQILLDYVNFFILSEQVRYHQDNWNKILNGKNDAIISILKIYIECAKRRFPNLILNELFKERFVYGTPAYFM